MWSYNRIWNYFDVCLVLDDQENFQLIVITHDMQFAQLLAGQLTGYAHATSSVTF